MLSVCLAWQLSFGLWRRNVFVRPSSAQVSAEHLDSDASKGFPHAETNEHNWKHETDQDYAQENQQLDSQ